VDNDDKSLTEEQEQALDEVARILMGPKLNSTLPDENGDDWGVAIAKMILSISNQVWLANPTANSPALIALHLDSYVDVSRLKDFISHPVDLATGAPNLLRLEILSDKLREYLARIAEEFQAARTSLG
jgi:hypothetical protein